MKFTYWFVLSMMVSCACAQTFSSGSTGADGALSYTTPGTYVFDPRAFTPALNPAGDNIFNFTTINIAAGVTVKLTGATFNSGVVWLASGTVKIDGTIDISGQDGFFAANTTQRTYTIPGPGGYSGGYPAIGSNPAGPGLGPAGGTGGNCGGTYGNGGGSSANQFLVPLLGGSGGTGSSTRAGGAGGGAILIASSVSISGAGVIKANGGASIGGGSAYSGAGAGGGIRLVAPVVSISGTLDAGRGTDNPCGGATNAAPGVVRIEAFSIGAINAVGNYYTATPFGLFLSTSGVPSLRVLTVGGNPVATLPTGTFTVPDVTVNSNSPLPMVIQASNVPVGTIPTLVIFSENGPDQVVAAPALAGTLGSSTSTVNVTLPPGFSKGFVKASFTQ